MLWVNTDCNWGELSLTIGTCASARWQVNFYCMLALPNDNILKKNLQTLITFFYILPTFFTTFTISHGCETCLWCISPFILQFGMQINYCKLLHLSMHAIWIMVYISGWSKYKHYSIILATKPCRRYYEIRTNQIRSTNA